MKRRSLALAVLLSLAAVSPTIASDAYGPITGTGRCRNHADLSSRYRFTILAGHTGLLEVSGDAAFTAPLRIMVNPTTLRVGYIGNPRRIWVRYAANGKGAVTILARRCPPAWY